jgi:tetratricopeptide (TPR) repeat protein
MPASELWDPHAHAAIVEWLMKTGRGSGSPLVLRLGLAQTAAHAAFTGDLGRAIAAIAEEEAIADATDVPPLLYPRLQLAAMRGHRAEALALFESATATATARGGGQLVANIHWAQAVLHNGSADYPAAFTAAGQAAAHNDLSLAAFALPELVKAAVRSGRPDAAAEALASLTERAQASGTSTGLGVAAYARGLVTREEEHYRAAIDHLEESPLLPYRARAHLLYGEWLRRQGRRRDCRRHLNTAHELLSGAGIEGFARRAADELPATGEKARGRSDWWPPAPPPTRSPPACSSAPARWTLTCATSSANWASPPAASSGTDPTSTPVLLRRADHTATRGRFTGGVPLDHWLRGRSP